MPLTMKKIRSSKSHMKITDLLTVCCGKQQILHSLLSVVGHSSTYYFLKKCLVINKTVVLKNRYANTGKISCLECNVLDISFPLCLETKCELLLKTMDNILKFRLHGLTVSDEINGKLP